MYAQKFKKFTFYFKLAFSQFQLIRHEPNQNANPNTQKTKIPNPNSIAN